MHPVVERQQAEARRVLDPAVWDWVDGGSGDEVSLAEAGWSGVRLRPRVLVDVGAVDTTTALLGTPLAAPILVGPTASHRFLHDDGEVATTTGARDAGSLTVVSTRSSTPWEEVVGPWWFQAYVTRDRSVTEQALVRAAAAGATAVVLTGDTPYVGVKRRAARIRSLADPWSLVNLGRHLPAGADPEVALEQDPAVTVADIPWIAGVCGLPVLVKGVLRADDARRCVDAGAAGIVVSNHGGRQLDRAVPTASALPEVAAAVDVPVLVDGGVRSGLDVLCALALGADAVLLGRPVLWALATGGAAAVTDLLGALRADLAHVMALAGAPSLAAVTADLVATVAAPH